MSSNDGPAGRYERVAGAIRGAIADGEFPVGSRLPSIQQLVEIHGVSHMTVKRALDVLRADGLVVSRSGVRAQVIGLPGEVPPPVQDQIDALRSSVEDLTERLAKVEAHVSQSKAANAGGP